MKYTFLVLFFTLLGCTDPSPVDLGDGYYLAKTNYHNAFIVERGSLVVYSHIESFEVTDKFVIGKKVKSNKPDKNAVDNNKPYGYFILNKKTGELLEGLLFEEYQAELKKINIYNQSQ